MKINMILRYFESKLSRYNRLIVAMGMLSCYMDELTGETTVGR